MSQYIFKKFEGRNSLFGIQGFYGGGEIFNKNIGEKLVLKSGHYYQDGFCCWIGHEDDYAYSRKWLIKKIEKENSWCNKFYKENYQKLSTYLESHIYENKLLKLKGNDLINATRDFIKKAADTIAPAYFSDWYGYQAEKWIREYINETQMSNDQFRIITSNNLISFSKEYEYELAKIKLNTSKETVENIYNKYYWTRDNYQHTGTLSLKTVKNELKEISSNDAREIIKFVETQSFRNEEKQKLLKNLNLNLMQVELLLSISKFVDLQELRKATVFITNFIVFQAFEKILDYKKITNKNDRALVLQSALPFWITDLENDELIKKSKMAKNGFLKIVYADEIFGDLAQKEFASITKETETDTKELKGYVASKGIASGVVKIIKRTEDFSSFSSGNILVSSMTRPEMVPIMKLASAFITDEGGITCHAAIVAREMKKPCIIGTKIATQILKDGDLVEVDANNGIIKIIKKYGN
jgi:phosphohistidine swiveling domain-containing protein